MQVIPKMLHSRVKFLASFPLNLKILITFMAIYTLSALSVFTIASRSRQTYNTQCKQQSQKLES